MGRNLILCSDGTGNKGGTGSDTNVFKIYHAIKGGISNEMRKQITFYDDGVGTATNSLARAIGGVTGAGFRKNVLDLYAFAGRHYQPGDDIYGFGFSRGAATIRAFAGMVECCGGLVLKTRPSEGQESTGILSEDEFQSELKEAMAYYERHGADRSPSANPSSSKFKTTQVDIEFLGVWDTVAALGFPQLPYLDTVVNFFRRHKFYNLEPRKTVQNIYHAVAIDDERRTFWPEIWDELSLEKNRTIEQVWFSGVHSNVGGGYPRAGLASVTLDWMASKLDEHLKSFKREDEKSDRGLILEYAFREDVRDAVNPAGKLMDSRGGLAVWYRFQPRGIASLCKSKLRGMVKIHSSVTERMKLRTDGYRPAHFPESFEVVENTVPANPSMKVEVNLTAKPDDWSPVRSEINKVTSSRILLYWFFLVTTVALVFASLYFWAGAVVYGGLGHSFREASLTNNLLSHVADTFRYVLPQFFENIINFGILVKPGWGLALAVTGVAYYRLRGRLAEWSGRACEKARVIVVERVAVARESRSEGES